jgi:hypothetical protein
MENPTKERGTVASKILSTKTPTINIRAEVEVTT